MSDSVTSEDALSIGSSAIIPISIDGDLETKVAEIIDRIEKQQGSINHLRKTVRLLRERVTMPEGLPQGAVNPLSSKEQNDALARYVDRTTFKNQMKQIARKIDEIAQMKGRSQQALETKVEESMKALDGYNEKLEQFKKVESGKIDLIAQKFESNVAETSKAILQMKKVIEDLKNKLKKAIKSTVDLNRSETNAVKTSLEESKKANNTQLNAIKKNIETIKEEIAALKISAGSTPPPSGEAGAQPTTSSEEVIELKKIQAKQSVNLEEIKAKLEEIENNGNSKFDNFSNQIDEISQKFTNSEKTSEEISNKLNDLESQYNLDCQQNREHDTQIDSELSKLKLMIEASETETKNTFEKLTADFNSTIKEANQNVKEINEKVAEIVKESSSNEVKIEEIKVEISQQVQSLKVEIQNVDSSVKEKIESFNSNTDSINSEASAVFQSQINEIKETINTQTNNNSLLESQINELRNNINETSATVKQELQANLDAFTQKEQQIIEQFNQINSSLTESLNQHKSEYSEFQENVQNQFNSFNEQHNKITLTFNALNQHFEAANASTIEILNNNAKTQDVINKALKEKIDELTSKIQSLNLTQGSLDSDTTNMIQTELSSLNQKYSEHENESNEYRSQIENSIKEINNSITQLTNNVNQVTTQFNEHNNVYNGSLEKIQEHINTSSETLRSFVQDSINTVQTTFNENNSKIITEVNEILNKRITEISQTFETTINNVKINFESHETSSNTTINNYDKRFEENEKEQNAFNENLKKQIEEIQQQLQGLISSNSNSKGADSEAKLKNEIENIAKQAIQVSETVKALEEENKKKLDEYATSIESVKAIVEQNRFNIEYQKSKFDSLKSKFEPMTSIIDQHSKIINERKLTIESFKKDIASLKSQIEQSNNESTKSLSQFTELVNNNKSEIQTLVENKIELILKTIESANQQNENNYSSINSRIEQLESNVKSAIGDIEIQKSSSKEEIININHDLETLIDSKLSIVNETINNIQNSITSVQNTTSEQITNMITNITTLQTNVEKGVNDNEIFTSLQQRLTEFESKINNQNEETENQIKAINDLIKSLEDKFNSKFENEIRNIKELSTNLKENQENITSKIQASEASFNNIKETTQSLQGLEDKFNSNFETIQSEIKNIKDLTQKLVTREENLNSKLQTSESEIKDIIEKAQSIQNSEKDLDNKISSVQTQIKSLKEENEFLKGQVHTHIELSENEIQTIKSNSATLNDKLNNKIVTSESEMQSTLEGIKNLQSLEEKLANKIKEVENEMKAIKEATKSLEKKVDENANLFSNKLDSEADAIAETVTYFKTAHEEVTAQVEFIQEKINQIQTNDSVQEMEKNVQNTLSDINDLKQRMFETFASANVLDAVKQKVKNLKADVRVTMSELQSLIESEKNERTDDGKEIINSIKELESKISNCSTLIEEESSNNKEQIQKIMKQIGRLQRSTIVTDNDNSSNNGSVSPEISMEIDEISIKVKKLEERNNAYQESFTSISQNLETLTNSIKENKEDYISRIENLQYISSEDRKDFMDNLNALQDRIDSTVKELEDCPRMVTNSIETNQMLINELSERVEGELTDMRSQLQQASFADDEIEELKSKHTQLEEGIKKFKTEINEKFELVDLNLEKRRQAEAEHRDMWAAINDSKVKIDVQLNTTNPHILHLINKVKETQRKFKDVMLSHKANEEDSSGLIDEIEKEDDDITEKGVTPPETSAEIATIKAKLLQLEEETRGYNETIINLKESIVSANEGIERATQLVHREISEMRDKLPDSFVELDAFNGLRNEVLAIHNALNSSIESSVEERSALTEQMNKLRETITNIQSGASNSESGEITSKEVIGADIPAPSSESAISELKLMINGVDVAAQKQIRKLKISLRKIQRAIDDAEAEEKLAQEREKQRKEEEERALERRREEEEENESDFVTDEDLVLQQKDAAATSTENHVQATAVSEASGAVNQVVVPVVSAIRLPTAIELIQDDFHIFFVLMFSVLLYFLVSDLFIS